ncbi:MAG TPA: hypothetical protein VGN42_13810, partial [Pirellulales bacterium]|nr:hypothetical protein [Pirellulales bacterium]
YRQNGRTAKARSVALALWDDEEAESTRLKSAISRASIRLAAKGLPVSISRSCDHVKLLIDDQ